MLRCKRIQIAGRASVYGFTPMNLDGHLPRWGVEEGEIERLARKGCSTPSSQGSQSPGMASGCARQRAAVRRSLTLSEGRITACVAFLDRFVTVL